MNIIKKWLRIPSGETVTVESHDTWRVEWWSVGRCNKGLGQATPRCEVLPSKEDADRFASELVKAAELLDDYKSQYGNWGPFVSKNNYKGVQQ